MSPKKTTTTIIPILLLIAIAGIYFFLQKQNNPASSQTEDNAKSTVTPSFDIAAWKKKYLKTQDDPKQWDKDFCQGWSSWFSAANADKYFVTWGPLGIRTLMNDPTWDPKGLERFLGWWQRKNMDGFQKTWPKPLVDSKGKLLIPSFSIKHVIPGSPADGHLQKGDILLTLNGKLFPLASEARGDAKPWNSQDNRSLALGAGMLMDQAESKDTITFTLLRIPEDKLTTLPTPPSGSTMIKNGKLNLPEALKPYLKTISFNIQRIGSFDPDTIGGGEKIDNIIKMQAEWLVKNQQADGSWKRIHGYTRNHFDTAWAMLGLMATGDPQYDPAIHKAAKYLSTCTYDHWSAPRAMALLAASEYYLKYKDKSYLPTVQRWVDLILPLMLPDMTVGHGYNPGYRGGSVAYGGSHVTAALAVAMKTPVKLPEHLLDNMLKRVQQLAPQGHMPYGRYQKNMGFKFPGDKATPNYNANHGPHLISSLIHGGPKKFTEICSAIYSKGSVGNMDQGHATETMSSTWGLLAANMVSPDAYQRHLNSLAWKITLLRTYRGGFGKNAYTLEFQGGEGLLNYALRSGAWLTALCGPRHQLAITGKKEFRASKLADVSPVNSYYANHLNYTKRNWGVADAVLNELLPNTKFQLGKKLPDLLAIPLDDKLPQSLGKFLEENAHSTAKEILQNQQIPQPLRSYLAELVIGSDITIDVSKKKESDDWEIVFNHEVPLAITHSKIPANYKLEGALTLEQNGKPVPDVKPVTLPLPKKNDKYEKRLTWTAPNKENVSLHIQYSIGDLKFDYHRPIKYVPNNIRACPRVVDNDRKIWVPGTIDIDHNGWNLSFKLPSGQRIAAASLGYLYVKVIPPKNSTEKPWISPIVDQKTYEIKRQLKAGTKAHILFVSARTKAEARIPVVQLK